MNDRSPTATHNRTGTRTVAIDRAPERIGFGFSPLSTLACAPPRPPLAACVVIPARDEADTIPTALAALAAQVDRLGRPLDPATYEVILLANNCRDGTAEAARATAARHPALTLHVVERELPPALAHVGAARRLLMDGAARRLCAVGRPRGIVASTDADSRVAPDWLAATAVEIAAGADVVGGRLLARWPEEPAPSSARAYYLRDAAYGLLLAELVARVDPDPGDPHPRHYQHFGASLAVTAEAYLRVGGLPPLPALEDMALVSALWRADARLRHSPAVRVRTSGRRAGRVPAGLSVQLAEWDTLAAAGAPLLVEAPAAIEARLRLRRAVRRAWVMARAGRAGWRRGVPALAGRLGVDAARLTDEIEGAPFFGALWDNLLAGLPVPPRTEAAAAVRHLRLRLADLRRSAPLPALQQVEPVGLFPAAAQVEERPPLPRRREKPRVDLVAGQRVVVDEGRPMDQQQVAAGVEGGDDPLADPRQVGGRPVVAHLRDHHQVEALGGELGRHAHPLDADVG